MRRTLLYTAAIGCFTVAGLSGCGGPSVEDERVASPQGETAKQQMEEEYQKQAEEMQEQMRQGRRGPR